MSLNSQVGNFLLSTDGHIVNAFNKLNFGVSGCLVDTEGYREMGHKVRQGAIAVEPASSSAGSSLSAVYTPGRDRLSVSTPLNLAGASGAAVVRQAEIVHEITHALMDFHRYAISDTLQEVLAYLAGTIYMRAHAVSASASEPRTQAILGAAQQVVVDRSMHVRAGQRLQLSDPDVAQLAAAIRGHSSYPNADTVRQADGVSGGLINPWYLPRRHVR